MGEIVVLFPDEQMVTYRLMRHSTTGLLVMFDEDECFIPHTSYTLYKKVKDK